MDRLIGLYKEGHRIVLAFSAGKDSGVCLELMRMAAAEADAGPVDVSMRDEEIMYPGTFEYAERMAVQPDINFHWIYARQPIINIFNRYDPYWWVFDERVPEDDWARKPPHHLHDPSNGIHVYEIPDKYIQAVITPERFPVPDGKDLYSVLGLRTSESMNRRMGLFSSKGWLTGRNHWGVRSARPIYDWNDSDVWKAIHDFGWDYNSAYDVMNRLGLPRRLLRIAPPTLTTAGLPALQLSRKAWPQWFERVNRRLPGLRTAAMFGMRAVMPDRRLGETWEDCYRRELIEKPRSEGVEWVASRAEQMCTTMIGRHAAHSRDPYPDTALCAMCGQNIGCWRQLSFIMYNGDPFSMKQNVLPVIEPEFFREGAGTWGGGKPAF